MSDIRSAVLARLAKAEIISAMANVHVRGMYSLVFIERSTPKSGMLRMFYIGEDYNDMNWLTCKKDFSLLPHNHRQEIQLIGLFGHVMNVRFSKVERPALDAPSYGVYEYGFGSTLLNGKFTLQRKSDMIYLKWELENLYTDVGDQSIIMKADEIHTVMAASPSAWIVAEHDVSDAEPLCYSMQPDLRLDSTGLYRKLDLFEREDLCREITKHAGEYHADYK